LGIPNPDQHQKHEDTTMNPQFRIHIFEGDPRKTNSDPNLGSISGSSPWGLLWPLFGAPWDFLGLWAAAGSVPLNRWGVPRHQGPARIRTWDRTPNPKGPAQTGRLKGPCQQVWVLVIFWPGPAGAPEVPGGPRGPSAGSRGAPVALPKASGT
jgi:hypothetical protein